MPFLNSATLANGVDALRGKLSNETGVALNRDC